MLKSKTVWGAATAILVIVSAYFLGEVGLGAMLQVVVTSCLSVFLKHAIVKDKAD